MKKIILFLVSVCSGVCFAAQPLLLINPSRETFLHFPSKILPDKVVTVFLPEPKVPLQQKYPVVYMLGVAPTDRQAAQQVLERAHQKAILVGINVTETELADVSALTNFMLRDVVPYIDTNYPTLDEPKYRAVAAASKSGAQAVAALLEHEQVFARAWVVNSAAENIALDNTSPALRIGLVGTQEQVASWLPLLQQKKLSFGVGFVTFISEKATLLGFLSLDYLFAPAEQVRLQQLKGFVSPKTISLSAENAAVEFRLWGRLANQVRVDIIPQEMRLSPPYLTWQAERGVLTPLSGAMPGKVTVKVVVDNLEFSEKIKLKK